MRFATAGDGQRRLSLALAFALLPMLSFAGHWPSRIPIPGTDYVIGESAAGHNHSHTHEKSDGHENHCHEAVATCSDLPLTSLASFHLAGSQVALLGSAFGEFLQPLPPEADLYGRLLPVDTPPPRAIA